MKIKNILILICTLFMSGCAGSLPRLKTVDNVDLDRFMGSWYVIAAIPTLIETKAYNGIEEYKILEDGSIDTVFTFNKGGFDGPVKRYNPRGFVVDKVNNSTWKMRFVWPFKAEYLITYLNEDYSQTIIGRNKRDYFWIMARTPEIPEADYQRLISILKEEGYDMNKVRKVPQRWEKIIKLIFINGKSISMKNLSVIIPTLNEAKNIERTIRALRNHASSKCQKQIIVVDGGSKDATADTVRGLDVALIEQPHAPKGRAFLLNKGADAAFGDILLFLDADSIVPEGYDKDIVKILEKPNVVGGAFEFSLDGVEFGLRVVEFINRIRYRIWKRYYGDQGIFVKKDIFYKAGQYPQIGLMEASEFCVALAQQGKLLLIKKPMLTSARRFLDHGIYRVLGFDIKMWWLNLIGKDVESFAKSYWRINEL